MKIKFMLLTLLTISNYLPAPSEIEMTDVSKSSKSASDKLTNSQKAIDATNKIFEDAKSTQKNQPSPNTASSESLTITPKQIVDYHQQASDIARNPNIRQTIQNIQDHISNTLNKLSGSSKRSATTHLPDGSKITRTTETSLFNNGRSETSVQIYNKNNEPIASGKITDTGTTYVTQDQKINITETLKSTQAANPKDGFYMKPTVSTYTVTSNAIGAPRMQSTYDAQHNLVSPNQVAAAA